MKEETTFLQSVQISVSDMLNERGEDVAVNSVCAHVSLPWRMSVLRGWGVSGCHRALSQSLVNSHWS